MGAKVVWTEWTNEKNTYFFSSSPQQFYTLYEQKCSSLRPLLSITFPQGFQKSKKFGHWTLGSGGKKTFKRGEQSVTDKHTYGNIDLFFLLSFMSRSASPFTLLGLGGLPRGIPLCKTLMYLIFQSLNFNYQQRSAPYILNKALPNRGGRDKF